MTVEVWQPPWGGDSADPSERCVSTLQQRVAELEQKLKLRDEDLAAERERASRARRKVRQLLTKVQERDAAILELRTALEQVAMGGSVVASAGRSNKTGSRPAHSSRQENGRTAVAGYGGSSSSAAPAQPASPRNSAPAPAASEQQAVRRLSRRQIAIMERAEIVRQLEDHLMQMRSNLAEGERELRDLNEKKKVKEGEFKEKQEQDQAPGEIQVHWQTMGMIGQQIQEKRTFNQDLSTKIRELEEQVRQQQALIEQAESKLARKEKGASACLGVESDSEDDVRPIAESPAVDEDLDAVSAGADEALQAFLAAAGSVAAVILERPMLHAAFEAQPPLLGSSAMAGLKPEEHAQIISLFAAWSAVASEAPHALRMSDINLKLTDLTELHGTLCTCGAQLEEVELMRCPISEARRQGSQGAAMLFRGLATQPLRQLSLGYNALGPSGAAALVQAASAWQGSLEHLGLEMNGLGDAGCREVAQALAGGLLPGLCSLELGWNELSAGCAPELVDFLEKRTQAFRRIGLGGNKLGCDGASALVETALTLRAQRPLDLDLSMNHVGSKPLAGMVAWAEDQANAGVSVAVSISLEWNVVDDAETALRLAKALARGGIASDSGAPLLRLGNNDELIDLDPVEVKEESRGLVVC